MQQNSNTPSLPPSNEKISQEDFLSLQLQMQKMETSKLKAELGVLESKLADANYQNLLLQIQIKYKMSPFDAMNQEGYIFRNLNAPKINANNPPIPPPIPANTNTNATEYDTDSNLNEDAEVANLHDVTHDV